MMNVYRLLGDFSHLFAITILLLNILRTRSCAGISGRSQLLFSLVYATRYLDLFVYFISVYNVVMKVIFLAISFGTLYLVWIQFKATYDRKNDTFRVEFLLIPCAILALIINHEFTFMEVTWAFSIYLEALAILPQFLMVAKNGGAEGIISIYLFALGSYRALYILNWVDRYYTENFYDLISAVAGVVQTSLYIFFAFIALTFDMTAIKNHLNSPGTLLADNKQKSLPSSIAILLKKICGRSLRPSQLVVLEEGAQKTAVFITETSADRTLYGVFVEIHRKNKQNSCVCGLSPDTHLSSRASLDPNYNTSLSWRRDPDEKYNDQLVRAANLVLSALKLRKSLSMENLPLDPARNDPAPNGDALSSSKIPRENEKLVHHFNTDAKHIVVLHGGFFFKFEVIHENGDIISPAAVFANLAAIMNSSTGETEVTHAPLTTSDRDQEAPVTRTAPETGNDAILRNVDNAALFLVLFEGTLSIEGSNQLNLANHSLHSSAHDRWFAKRFTMIVTKCGNACINFEYPSGDGAAVQRYFDDIHKDSVENHQCHPGDSVRAELVSVEKLEFKVDAAPGEVIGMAMPAYDTSTNHARCENARSVAA